MSALGQFQIIPCAFERADELRGAWLDNNGAIGSSAFRPVTMMKLAPFCVFVFVQLSPVYALDCVKVSSPVDRLICMTPELKKADEEMGAAYFKLLRETTDPEFHEALIQSQRRWLKARSAGPDRFGQAEGDKTNDREVFLKMTRDRLTFLRNAEPIRVMEQERKIISKDSGGIFAGFETYCVLQPPPYGNWTYECWGGAHRQNQDRVCSSAMQWASGHTSEERIVSVLKNGELKPVASCSSDKDSTDERCPDPDDVAESKAIAHWNMNPKPADDLAAQRGGRLWKYDPDIEPDQIARQWMQDCLFAPIYPPPEVSGPKSVPKK